MRYRTHPRMPSAYIVCKPLTGSADTKETLGLQRVCKWHSLAPQPPGPTRGLKCPSGHSRVRMRTRHFWCVGCDKPPSVGSGSDLVRSTPSPAICGRCRQGSEPSRRLSDTTLPGSVSAFRAAFQAAELTVWCSPGKREVSYLPLPAVVGGCSCRAPDASVQVNVDAWPVCNAWCTQVDD